MNILHLDSEKTWRGGQNQTKILIDGLESQGINCHLAASEDSSMYKTMHGKIPTIAIEMRGALPLFPAAILARYCRTHSIDIIDAQGSKAHSLAVLVRRKCKTVKVVVHRRVDYLPKKHFFNRYKYFSAYIDQYIAISDAIGNVLKAFGVEENRISVVKSCATPLTFNFSSKQEAKLALAAKEGFDPALPLIGNVSALTNQKDYPTLLKALRHLKDKGEKFFCVIAGDGELCDKLHRMHEELDLASHVKFLGFRKDVPDVLQALDVLAMTSQYEGLGTIILDAIQAGCCVVATNVGGIPEIISHEKTGLLSKPRMPKAFANNLAKAIKTPELRAVLNTAAKDLVAREFSAEKMIAGNLDVYRKVLSK
jgi:glycosyltransferase involved in cell wall biosynthesis